MSEEARTRTVWWATPEDWEEGIPGSYSELTPEAAAQAFFDDAGVQFESYWERLEEAEDRDIDPEREPPQVCDVASIQMPADSLRYLVDRISPVDYLIERLSEEAYEFCAESYEWPERDFSKKAKRACFRSIRKALAKLLEDTGNGGNSIPGEILSTMRFRMGDDGKAVRVKR